MTNAVYKEGEKASESDGLHVGIAEYAVTTDGTILSTSGLGSCVGVALIDQSKCIAGLAHIMLPDSDGETAPKAKYADTGVQALVNQMEAQGTHRANLIAKFAGGSSMFTDTSIAGDIGNRNINAVKRILNNLDIPVESTDLGGSHGRSLKLDPHTGDLHIQAATGTSQIL